MYLSSDRLEQLRRAAGNQSGPRADLLPLFRGAYDAILMFIAPYNAEDHTPSYFYDELFPNVVEWTSFCLSHPSFVPQTPDMFATSTYTLTALSQLQIHRDSLAKHIFILGDIISCWLFLSSTQALISESTSGSSETTYHLQGLMHLLGAIVMVKENDELFTSMAAILEARTDDVAGALVSHIVGDGLAGGRPIGGQSFMSLRVLCTLARRPRLRPSFYARNIITIVCRLMRRLARGELVVVHPFGLCDWMEASLSTLQNLLTGPVAAMEALQARCLPTVLRMHSSFGQAKIEPFYPEETVDDHVLPVVATIRGYAQIPSFRKIIGKSLRCVDQMLTAKTSNTLRISGRVEAEYKAICASFGLIADRLPVGHTASRIWCAAHPNVRSSRASMLCVC